MLTISSAVVANTWTGDFLTGTLFRFVILPHPCIITKRENGKSLAVILNH